MNVFNNFFTKIRKHSLLYVLLNVFALLLAIAFYHVERSMETISATIRIGKINQTNIEDIHKIEKKFTEVKHKKWDSIVNGMTISAIKNLENSEISIYIKSNNSIKATEHLNKLINELITRHNIQVHSIRHQHINNLKKALSKKILLLSAFKNCLDLDSENYTYKSSCEKSAYEIINGINLYELVSDSINNEIKSINQLSESIIINYPYTIISSRIFLNFYILKLLFLTFFFSNSLFIFLIILFNKNKKNCSI